jgi:hypothetical protein
MGSAVTRDWIEYFLQRRQNGGVRQPRPYLLVLGTRR